MVTAGSAPTLHASALAKEERRDWLSDELDDAGLEYIDRRPNDGCLWIINTPGAIEILERLNDRGASFKLSRHGDKATGGRSAWWLRGYPKEKGGVAKVKPPVTKAELDALKPGDTVFPKAFGYGQIVDLDSSYIEVSFENDNHKKKPSRKFVFPGSFYQGLLRIG